MLTRFVAATAVAVASPLATPGTGSGPSTSEPIAVFRVFHDPAGDRIARCKGTDGDYEQIESSSTGRIVSSDPRLTGTMRNAERILINRTMKSASLFADAVIVDEETGAQKFAGTIVGALKGAVLRGVLSGRLTDGSVLVANFSVAHDPNTTDPHTLTGTIGGASLVPADFSVLQTGGCGPSE